MEKFCHQRDHITRKIFKNGHNLLENKKYGLKINSYYLTLNSFKSFAKENSWNIIFSLKYGYSAFGGKVSNFVPLL